MDVEGSEIYKNENVRNFFEEEKITFDFLLVEEIDTVCDPDRVEKIHLGWFELYVREMSL